jgi:hypothetical protein
LDLTNNPLYLRGDENSFGVKELREIFGDKFICNSIQPGFKRITKKEAYSKLERNFIHWNFKVLQKIKPCLVKRHALKKVEILDCWNCILMQCGGEIETCKFKVKFENYIATLYENYEHECDDKDYRIDIFSERMDLIENILVKLIQNKNIEEMKTFIFELESYIGWCAVGQVERFRVFYNILFCTNICDSFKNYIEKIIAVYKNEIFTLVVTPSRAPQNVHVLNKWRYKMRDEIGLISEVKPDFETYGQDLFEDSEGNVLDAFYKKFTPDFIVKIIVEEINKDKTVMAKCASFMLDEMKKNFDDVVDSFEYVSQEEKDMIKFDTIKTKTVLRILSFMDIVY